MHSRSEQYTAFTDGAGWVDVSDRTQIEIRGDDRAAFLHNMSTQEIKNLAPGQGAEAFLTDAKGHVLAMVDLFVTPDSMVIDTVPGQYTAIFEHLDKYVIREDVQLADRQEEWGQLLVGGGHAREILATIAEEPLPDELWQHSANRIAEREIYVRRVPQAGAGSLAIVGSLATLEQVKPVLTDAGVVACDADVLETVRIENRVPLYGRDVTERNLPQEVDRNATAINFNKGCYIGQETVARLDALGHVNRRLALLKFDGTEVPSPGAELQLDGQTVGAITSSTFSPEHNAPLALAYVRYAHSTPGVRLTSATGDAVVI